MKYMVPSSVGSKTTLHPIIAYYPCPCKCGHLVHDEIMILSDDTKHDSFAVNKFCRKGTDTLEGQ